MLEKTLRFFQREQYIDPQYQKQITEWDKNQRIEKVKELANKTEGVSSAILEAEKGNILKAYTGAAKIGWRIRGEIDELDTSSFPLLLFCAIVIDFVDLVPPLDLAIGKILTLILFVSLIFNGRYLYKFYARTFQFILCNVLNLIPVIDKLPLETIAVVLIWRKIAQARKEKESELSETEQKEKLIAVAGGKVYSFKEFLLQKQAREELSKVAAEENNAHQNDLLKLKEAA